MVEIGDQRIALVTGAGSGRESHEPASESEAPARLARITIFVRGYRPEHIPIIEVGRQALFGDHKPADALVGVETLADPAWLIEVDALAVVEAA